MRSTTLLAFVLARLALASEPEAEFCAPTVIYHYCVLDDCLEALSNRTQAAPVFCNEYLENDSIDVPSYVPATAGPPDISSACNCVLLAATEFPTPISSSGLLSGPPTILSPQTSTVPVPSYPAEVETETLTPTFAPIYTTSTVYKVLAYTSEGQTYTDTVVDYTTICPITESSQTPVTPSTSCSEATTTEPASHSSTKSRSRHTHSTPSQPFQNSTCTSSTLSSSTLSISSSSVAPLTSSIYSSISSQNSSAAAASSTTSSTLSSSSAAPSTSSSYSSSTSSQSSSSAAASSTTSSTLSSSSTAPSTSSSYSSSTSSQSSSSAAASSTTSSTLSSSSTSTVSSTTSCSPSIPTSYSLVGGTPGGYVIQLLVTIDLSLPCGSNGLNGYTITSLSGYYNEIEAVTFDPTQTLGNPDYCLYTTPDFVIVDTQGFDFTAGGSTYRVYYVESDYYSVSGAEANSIPGAEIELIFNPVGPGVTCPSSSVSTTSLSSSSSSTSSTSTTTSSAAASSTTTSSSTTSSAAASSTTSCTLPAETQLVVNPGFEIDTDGSYTYPWSLNGQAYVEDNTGGFSPYDGNDFVYLRGAYESVASLSQTISGFVAASPYTLSFYLAAGGSFQTEAGTCFLSVTLAGVQVYFLNINNNIYSTFPGRMYYQQEVTITPTGSTETLEFDLNCEDAEQFPDLALDDITITGLDACPAFCSTDPAAEAFASAGAEATLYCNDFLGIPQPSTVTIQAAATSTIFTTTTVSPTPTPTLTVSQSPFAPKDKRYPVPDTLTREFPFTSTYNSAQQSAACSCLSIQPALASTTSTTTMDITSTVVVTAAPTTFTTTSTPRTITKP